MPVFGPSNGRHERHILPQHFYQSHHPGIDMTFHVCIAITASLRRRRSGQTWPFARSLCELRFVLKILFSCILRSDNILFVLYTLDRGIGTLVAAS